MLSFGGLAFQNHVEQSEKSPVFRLIIFKFIHVLHGHAIPFRRIYQPDIS